MENLYRHSARLYDIEQNCEQMRDHLTSDIPFYLEYAKRQQGKILELGCGTGRVAMMLAQEGFHITGLDLSQQMLDVFQEKLSRRQELTDKVKLAHGSMADFSFNDKYSLIITPFRAFQAVTDDADIKKTLISALTHLANDGLFIVNVFNPYPIMDESWCRNEEEFDFEVIDNKTGIHVMRKSRRERIDIANQIIYPYLAYYVTHPDGSTERIVDYLQLKYYYSHQLRTVVEKAGFEIIEEYSWYDKSPLDGREIIFICRR